MPMETTKPRSTQRVQESYQASRAMVREHPLPSTLTVFGLGFGLGVVLGVMLSEPEPASRWDQVNRQWDHLGRQVVDAVHRAVPDAIAKRLG
ncbi:MAG: hypothetical protein KY475_12320 [Planctomycetes bacterium]|nr:hypothetical protein [Planctomycetota bacterium]